jgi:DHA1 family multidrug resistance protein-like MFS transporter
LGIVFFVHEDFKRPEPKPDGVRSHWWDGVAMVLRSRDLLLILGARLLTRTATRVIGPVLPLFVAALLPESARIATMAGIVAGASAASSSVGSVVLGRMGDRIGYRRVLLGSAAAASIIYLLQATVNSIVPLILLQICVGFALAGSISALTAMLATLAPEEQTGAVFGVSTSVFAGANAIGPMMGASVAVAFGNRATFVLASAVFMLAVVLIALFLPDRQPSAHTPPEPVSAHKSHQPKPAKTR